MEGQLAEVLATVAGRWAAALVRGHDMDARQVDGLHAGAVCVLAQAGLAEPGRDDGSVTLSLAGLAAVANSPGTLEAVVDALAASAGTEQGGRDAYFAYLALASLVDRGAGRELLPYLIAAEQRLDAIRIRQVCQHLRDAVDGTGPLASDGRAAPPVQVIGTTMDAAMALWFALVGDRAVAHVTVNTTVPPGVDGAVVRADLLTRADAAFSSAGLTGGLGLGLDPCSLSPLEMLVTVQLLREEALRAAATAATGDPLPAIRLAPGDQPVGWLLQRPRVALAWCRDSMADDPALWQAFTQRADAPLRFRVMFGDVDEERAPAALLLTLLMQFPTEHADAEAAVARLTTACRGAQRAFALVFDLVIDLRLPDLGALFDVVAALDGGDGRLVPGLA